MKLGHGRVVEVRTRALASELTAAAAAGTRVLSVEDTSEFADPEVEAKMPFVQLVKADDDTTVEVRALDAIDDDALTITLVDVLVGAWAVGDRVEVYPETKETTAEVVLDDADEEAVPMRVPVYLRPFLPTGVRDLGDQESVAFFYDGEDYVVADILGGAEAQGEDVEATWSKSGDLTNGFASVLWRANRDYEIMRVRVTVKDAPTTAELIVDLHRHLLGTMFTTAARRASVAAGNKTGVSKRPDVRQLSEGEYLQPEIVQNGGAKNITVQVILRPI